MAPLLFRLGRGSARRPLTVIVLWLAVLAVAGGAYLTVGGKLADSFSIPGLETERVANEMATQLPGLTGGSARVVFHTDDGTPFTPAQEAQISAALDAVTRLDTVTGALDPFAMQAQQEQQAQQLQDSADQLAAAQADLDAAAESGADVTDARAELNAQAQHLALGTELAGYASGIRTVSSDHSAALAAISFGVDTYELTPTDKQAVIETISSMPLDGVTADFSAELTTDVSGVLGVGEIAGVLIAFVVLFLMMRAFWPAVQPLITSVLGVGVGVATALAFSGVVDMQSVTPVLGVMLGLAVGIDYSLFILNRHRTQLRQGMDVLESIGLANGTAGNAVIFAASTVMVALLALNVTGVPFLGIMGTVAAFCVAVAALSAITLTPAILGLMGMRALGRKARAHIGQAHTEAPVRPMRRTTTVLASIGSVAALLVIAIPSLSMRLGLPDGTQEPQDSTQYRAHQMVSTAFGPGLNGTMLVTATLPGPVGEDGLLAAQVRVASVLAANDNVAAVAPAGQSADGSYLAFQVVPADGPSSVGTQNLVHELRDLSPLDDGTVLGVAGEASGSIDVIEKLNDALPLYLAVVVALSLVILIIVFRSLVVPVLATAGFVLSLFGSFGVVTAVYQWGWASSFFGVHDPSPLLAFLPILLTGILFGLAMDYQLFITTGMREAYVHGLSARHAVVAGVRHGRAVVTAAAIIMISVFGGFVFSDLGMVRPIGMGLAVGVLLDAFVVRMVLLPSLMDLFGEAAWWLPRWLERILPNVDVEGAQLERAHPLHQVADATDVADAAAATV